uniref:C2H2-type domain-containing protein n=1 Tax=Amphilophus citrinellus TaxID=61819 RepID=A0A3Q0SJH3_AMPCI
MLWGYVGRYARTVPVDWQTCCLSRSSTAIQVFSTICVIILCHYGTTADWMTGFPVCFFFNSEPEPPQIKEDQVELSSSQQGEQLVLKEETDTFMVTAVYEESDHSEAEPDREQLLPHSSAVAESQDQEGSYNVVLGSTRNAESDPNKHHRNQSHSNNLEDSSMSESQRNTDAGKNSVKCDICGKVFKKKSIMKEHHRIHTGEKPYTCETCGKSFGKNSNLLTHMKTHTGEKPYSCKTCGKCFTVRSNLLAHIRVHTGEKPFLCKTCGKRFSDSSALKRHKVVHTGEKPYSCQTCGKSLTESSSLLVHMRIHTGEKPYHCKTCGKMFRQRNHLLAHMKTHRGQSRTNWTKRCKG